MNGQMLLDRLASDFERVRAQTEALAAPLSAEDQCVQSMPDASPTKWHRAHTTWFFETFVLGPAGVEGLSPEPYAVLFNSYYNAVGEQYHRPSRGLLTRPSHDEVTAYRKRVDDALLELLRKDPDEEITRRIEVGLHHEQQHQELLLTDIKHLLSRNPIHPAMNPSLPCPPSQAPDEYGFSNGHDGIHQVGADKGTFCFDNESPRHDTLLQEHRIGDRLVTNAEYRDFIEAGGYADSQLWLSDGWSTINERGWSRPLYWSKDLASEFTLGGLRDIDPHAPVCHVSYYEADAFARWAGARLPTEFEWELAAATEEIAGNFVESGFWQPGASEKKQFFGDVWEWTSSAYLPYPGFTPLEGSLGEYNGKFMSGQMTVRGGSCATARDHIRASYRSFFYPDARWQFLGIRLAKDGLA